MTPVLTCAAAGAPLRAATSAAAARPAGTLQSQEVGHRRGSLVFSRTSVAFPSDTNSPSLLIAVPSRRSPVRTKANEYLERAGGDLELQGVSLPLDAGDRVLRRGRRTSRPGDSLGRLLQRAVERDGRIGVGQLDFARPIAGDIDNGRRPGRGRRGGGILEDPAGKAGGEEETQHRSGPLPGGAGPPITTGRVRQVPDPAISGRSQAERGAVSESPPAAPSPGSTDRVRRR